MKLANFHADALLEMAEQASYCEERSHGLGQRFVDAVEAAADLAASMPGIGSPYKHKTRRVFPRRFPHSLVHRERADDVLVVAVAPFSRRPGYWRQRA